jgi:hypothetical protein
MVLHLNYKTTHSSSVIQRRNSLSGELYSKILTNSHLEFIMKKVAILFIVLLTSSFVFAQNTYVPDDKFEQALIDLGYDTTLDDSVLTANISGVTSLNVSEKEISDLTGIEALQPNLPEL